MAKLRRPQPASQPRRTGATRVAIITGAARGIGRATAEAFARQGYSVVLAAGRRREPSGAAVEVTRRRGITITD